MNHVLKAKRAFLMEQGKRGEASEASQKFERSNVSFVVARMLAFFKARSLRSLTFALSPSLAHLRSAF